MHTNPEDSQGTNLLQIANHLDILDNVCFSDQTATYEQINVLHNIEEGKLDQHEGSFEVGKLLKEIYIDLSLIHI